MEAGEFKLLLSGIDTIQCAYYLSPIEEAYTIDFDHLSTERENIRQSKNKNPLPIDMGVYDFLLQPYGTSSGYPLVIKNRDFKIEFGEYNWPNFFVTFNSEALWRDTAFVLHEKFLKWVESIGYQEYKTRA